VTSATKSLFLDRAAPPSSADPWRLLRPILVCFLNPERYADPGTHAFTTAQRGVIRLLIVRPPLQQRSDVSDVCKLCAQWQYQHATSTVDAPSAVAIVHAHVLCVLANSFALVGCIAGPARVTIFSPSSLREPKIGGFTCS
jgi:hypothetical protein